MYIFCYCFFLLNLKYITFALLNDFDDNLKRKKNGLGKQNFKQNDIEKLKSNSTCFNKNISLSSLYMI